MKTFCFTVDDNIRFLKEITERKYDSLFEHPYLAVYKRLHDELGLKVQLNLFYRTIEGDFNLSQVTDEYYDEWKQNADWLKLSFHSQWESMKPYEFSGYDEVYADCKAVYEQIVRFASPAALADTTIHFCLATSDGLRALSDNKVKGLLGLFGNDVMPRTSYELAEEQASQLRAGKMVVKNDMVFAPIDEIIDAAEKNTTGKPVLLIDAADSPNGGAVGDSCAVALRLMERGSKLRTGMFIIDPAAVDFAFEVGVGNKADFSVGAGYTKGMPGPLKAEGLVRSLHDGWFRQEGKAGRGNPSWLGKTAVVSFGDIDVVLCCRCACSGDPQVLRHFGVDPALCDLVVVKANTSFKEPYSSISDLVYFADTPRRRRF